MQTLESNRTNVLLFAERLSRRDFDGMAELVTSDATWWVVGRPDYFPQGGSHPLTHVLRIIDSFIGSLDEFVFSVDSSTAEGDCVVIEATSFGRKGTACYNNVYLMKYWLRCGKIQSVREFFDAYEITEFLKQMASA